MASKEDQFWADVPLGLGDKEPGTTWTRASSKGLVVGALRTELLLVPRPRLSVGVGRPGRAALAERLDRIRPPRVVLLGFCGGLRSSLAPGDLILGDFVIDRDGVLRLPPEEVARAAEALPWARVGGLVSVDHPADPAEKVRLGIDALGVDMESGPLCRELVARGIPFLLVRAVLDAAWEEIRPAPRHVLWAGRALACARRLGVAARALQSMAGSATARSPRE